MAFNLIEELKKLLSSAESDTPDDEEIAAAEDLAENDTEAEREADGITADEVEAENAEAAADTNGEGGDGDTPDEELTPGAADSGEANTDDLRALITEQAAIIETLRNTVAELGGVDPTAIEAEEIADESIDTEDEDVVAAFDSDYDSRKAQLAALLEGN